MKKVIVFVTIFAFLFGPTLELSARGRGGGGRGGGAGRSVSRGGGGMSRGGGGASFSRGGAGVNRGGGVGRPAARPSTPSFNRPSSRPSTPSFSRPSSRPSMPSRPATRPSTPPSFNRPSTPTQRPSTRPSTGRSSARPSIPGTSRPSIPGTTRPSIRPGERPSIRPGDRPLTLPGTRPGKGDRPTIRPGDRPSTLPATRPGTERPTIRPGDRPGIGDRPAKLPGLGPGLGAGLGDRDRPSTRPGLGDRLERPSKLPDRPSRQERREFLADRLKDRDVFVRDGDRDRWRDRWDDHRHDRDRYWRDRHWYHYHWYHGFWPVYYPGYWSFYWWDRYPVLSSFGLTYWSVNRCGWATGYYNYYNPYATPYVIDQGSVYYNYSQPIQVIESYPRTTDGPAAPPEVSDETLSTFDRAMQEFYAGEYETALNSANEALKELPNDAAVHEFRALVLFAVGRYEEAAATLYAVLSVGPGWDWTTMSTLYPSVDVYTSQLRALEAYRNEHPQESAPRFVLAYHYVTAGHEDAAAGQLKRVVQLNPKDELSRNLLLSIDPKADVPAPEITEPPKPAAPIQQVQLVGKWNAQREGDRFVMDLRENGNFTWTYKPSGGEEQTISGVWAVDEDGVLALDMGEDDVMLAQLNLTGGDLDFYMLGDTQGAEPLKFRK